MAVTSILDTNVLVRFLVADNKAQKAKAVEWFKQAESGERSIIVKPTVIAETVFVLESFYKHPRAAIVASLLPFVAMPSLMVEERYALLRLWDDYIDGLHFVDAYLLACARVSQADLLTFDQKLFKRAHE